VIGTDCIDSCQSEHLGHFEIAKYKRESNIRMPIKMYLFIFVNIKRVKISNENTVADGNVLCKRIHSTLTGLVDYFEESTLGVHSPLS